jgi:hypothetical protein
VDISKIGAAVGLVVVLTATSSVFVTLLVPRPQQSRTARVTAAVMDAAAMTLALAPSRANPNATLSIRMGFMALRDNASASNITFDEDPRPDDPDAQSQNNPNCARLARSAPKVDKSH